MVIKRFEILGVKLLGKGRPRNVSTGEISIGGALGFC